MLFKWLYDSLCLQNKCNEEAPTQFFFLILNCSVTINTQTKIISCHKTPDTPCCTASGFVVYNGGNWMIQEVHEYTHTHALQIHIPAHAVLARKNTSSNTHRHANPQVHPGTLLWVSHHHGNPFYSPCCGTVSCRWMCHSGAFSILLATKEITHTLYIAINVIFFQSIWPRFVVFLQSIFSIHIYIYIYMNRQFLIKAFCHSHFFVHLSSLYYKWIVLSWDLPLNITQNGFIAYFTTISHRPSFHLTLSF